MIGYQNSENHIYNHQICKRSKTVVISFFNFFLNVCPAKCVNASFPGDFEAMQLMFVTLLLWFITKNNNAP